MLLGVRIKNLREEKGLTQSELAKRINVTKSAISYYENGFRMPTVHNLHALAEVFDVSLDTLLGNDCYEVAEENDGHYGMYMAKEEIEFISEIRRYPKIYQKIIENPKRYAELINKKL